MNRPAQPETIIFAERNGLSLYSPGLSSVVTWIYPPAIVSDLDVKNVEALRNEIKNLVVKTRVAPRPFVMILGPSVCFEKKFPMGSEDDSRKFIDAIPFDYVRYRSYAIGKSSQVVVANRDYYEALDIAFERLGFTTIAICPLSALGLVLPPTGFDANLGKALLQKMELAKDQGFYTPGALSSGEKQETKTSEKKRVTLLLGIFGLLTLVLGIVLIMSLKQNSTPPPTQGGMPATPNQSVVSPVTEAVSPILVSPTSSESKSATYRILILNGSKTPRQADQVKKQLEGIGFTDITVSNSTQSASVRTEITFNNLVKPEVIDQIIQELQKTFSDISSVEASPSGFDIRIVTGTAKVTAP